MRSSKIYIHISSFFDWCGVSRRRNPPTRDPDASPSAARPRSARVAARETHSVVQTNLFDCLSVKRRDAELFVRPRRRRRSIRPSSRRHRPPIEVVPRARRAAHLVDAHAVKDDAPARRRGVAEHHAAVAAVERVRHVNVAQRHVRHGDAARGEAVAARPGEAAERVGELPKPAFRRFPLRCQEKGFSFGTS